MNSRWALSLLERDRGHMCSTCRAQTDCSQCSLSQCVSCVCPPPATQAANTGLVGQPGSLASFSLSSEEIICICIESQSVITIIKDKLLAFIAAVTL